MAAFRASTIIVSLLVLLCHEWADGRGYSSRHRMVRPSSKDRPTPHMPPVPQRPVVDPGRFFHFTNYLPFDFYSNYMCALLNVVYPGAGTGTGTGAQKNETCYGRCTLGLGKTDIHPYYWVPSSTFFKRLENIERFMRPLRQPVIKYYSKWVRTDYVWKKVYIPTKVPDTRKRTSVQEILFDFRESIKTGYSRSNLEKIRRLLKEDLTICDLHAILKWLYYDNGALSTVVQIANKAKMYYVSDPRSSKNCLAGDDLKRLMVNMVLVANRLVCPRVSVQGYTGAIDYNSLSHLLWDRLIEFSLPEGYSKHQRQQVGSAMNFLKETDLSHQQYWNLLDAFVYSQFQVGNIDRLALCYVLNNFATGSSRCGIRYVVLRMAQYLRCPTDGDLFPSTTTTTTTPTTTTTTTPTTTPTTTTTTTKTSLPSTTIFIAPFPPLPSSSTTTTRSSTPTTTTTPTSTSTTTTTTPTTTSTTTTTASTTPAQARCGISGMASRIARMEKSDLLVTPRIVGGSVTGSCRLYPWMAFINVGEYQCGGAIIDETHILTAAHCFETKGTLVKVTVGEYYTRSPEGTEQVFNVDPSGIFLHNGFNKTDTTNDIAVLKLDKPIDLNRPCAEPICLESSRRVTNGENCVAAGWGVTKDLGSSTSSRLKSVNLPVFRGTDCEKTFPPLPTGYKLTDPANQLCAGEPKLGQADACASDSGSPLVCQDKDSSRWVAVGIVSYGFAFTCGRAGIPGVYTRVASHYDWIQQQLKK